MVEVTSFPRGTVKRYLVRDYLKRIANGTLHPSIEIKSAEIILVNTSKDNILLIDSVHEVVSCESKSQMIVRFNEAKRVIETLPTRKIVFTVNKWDAGCGEDILYISKIGNISLIEKPSL